MNLFKKFFSYLPKKKELEYIIHTLSKREYIFFLSIAIILIISSTVTSLKLNELFLIERPTHGGSITEGIIGTPRFINPVLATSDSDRDLALSALVFSGLTRKTPDGEIIPDLAKEFSVSEDGTLYTFILKDDLVFHNNKEITSDDIIFTIEKIKDASFGSPKKGLWDGVEVERIDEKTIVFSLKQPYASFMENNTTQGIISKELWKDVSAEQFSQRDLNIEAIGSGPYKIENIKRKKSGVIESIKLSSFNKFALGKPYIRSLTFNFYDNEKEMISAFENQKIDTISAITPEKASEIFKDNHNVETSILPRIFGLFFNQNKKEIFVDKNIIKAFNLAINKDRIVSEVLFDYGTTINSPLPIKSKIDPDTDREQKINEAKEILEKAGWKEGENGIREKTVGKNTETLSFSIATSNSSDLKKVAELIEQDLRIIGADVTVAIFETGSLNQTIIRPREYDVLLFGQIIGHESNLYSFWHSSKRNDPGLNIALYTNSKADTLLEDALLTTDEEKRQEKYKAFEQEVAKDSPSVFLYSPSFIYGTDNKIKNIQINNIKQPSERFININEWYIQTEKVWPIFLKNKTN